MRTDTGGSSCKYLLLDPPTVPTVLTVPLSLSYTAPAVLNEPMFFHDRPTLIPQLNRITIIPWKCYSFYHPPVVPQLNRITIFLGTTTVLALTPVSSSSPSSSYALLRGGQGTGQTYATGTKLYTYAYIW